MFFILLKPGFIIACRPSKHKFFYSVLHVACLFTVSLFPLQRIVPGRKCSGAQMHIPWYMFLQSTHFILHIPWYMLYNGDVKGT